MATVSALNITQNVRNFLGGRGWVSKTKNKVTNFHYTWEFEGGGRLNLVEKYLQTNERMKLEVIEMKACISFSVVADLDGKILGVYPADKISSHAIFGIFFLFA